MKKIIITILITAIICTGIGVYAGSTINASSIIYTKQDGTDTTVDTVLNDFYTATNTYKVADRVCAYSFNNIVDFQVNLPDLTNYNTLTIGKVTMQTGTPYQFKLRHSSGDKADFALSNSPQTIDVSSLTGTGYYLLVYSRDAGDWGSNCIYDITLSR